MRESKKNSNFTLRREAKYLEGEKKNFSELIFCIVDSVSFVLADFPLHTIFYLLFFGGIAIENRRSDKSFCHRIVYVHTCAWKLDAEN